jgi:hypothetical protein
MLPWCDTSAFVKHKVFPVGAVESYVKCYHGVTPMPRLTGRARSRWLPRVGPAQDRRTRTGFAAVAVAQSKER